MTTKAVFSPEEWKVVLEGPSTAGMIVITAARGGMFRETVAMAKAYTEARAEHGESELLDEIVAAKSQKTTPGTVLPKNFVRTGSGSSATRWPCSGARRPPRNSMTTGASYLPWPTRWLPPTGKVGKA